MKKIFTLAIASLLSLAMFAADHRPAVTLVTNKKFEVVIDGRSYGSAIGNSMTVQGMYNGRHTIKVYALKNGLFSRQKRLVSTSSFVVNRNDISIMVDRFGEINVQEQRSFDRDGKDHTGWDNRGYNNRDGNDRDNRNDSRHDKGRF